MTRSVRYALAATLVVFTNQAVAQVPDYNTAAYCERTSSGSFYLEKVCRESENTSRRLLERSDIPMRMWRHCRSLGGDSYYLLHACMVSEAEASGEMPSVPTAPTAPPRAIHLPGEARNSQNTPGVVIMRGDEKTIQPTR